MVLLGAALLAASVMAREALVDADAGAARAAGAEAGTLRVRMVVDVEAIGRLAGPEVRGLVLEVLARRSLTARALAAELLCARLRGAGAAAPTDGCPEGGVIAAGPDGRAGCSRHGGAGDAAALLERVRHEGAAALKADLLARGVRTREQTADGVVRACLARLETIDVEARLDASGRALDPHYGRVALAFAAGSRALERLGLAPRSPSAEPVAIELDRGADRARLVLAPASATLELGDAIGAFDALPGTAPPRTTDPMHMPLVDLSVPVAETLWRRLEQRIPGNVTLGRAPSSVRVIVSGDGVRAVVDVGDPMSALSFENTLATALTVARVATAFKRKDAVDQVLEWLFRAPRTIEGSTLVIEGGWPPELRGGVAASVERAAQDSPERFGALACRLRQRELQRAATAWESERGAPADGVDALVREGLLAARPACPLGGPLELSRAHALCATHVDE